ncbi:MAG TPA: DUF983 domain-containing protein [Actinomycetota bacterium]|nr:DUF983 domain-containing protein [Actinomycetota bacterium]
MPAPRRKKLGTALRALARGSLKRCPRCGQNRLFRGFFRLVESCPRCGLRFEREEGMWVGAMIINTTVTSLAFVAVLVGGLLLTWPEVPVLPLTLACLAANAVTPVVFYPWSKTIWVAVDLLMHGGQIMGKETGAPEGPRR